METQDESIILAVTLTKGIYFEKTIVALDSDKVVRSGKVKKYTTVI